MRGFQPIPATRHKPIGKYIYIHGFRWRATDFDRFDKAIGAQETRQRTPCNLETPPAAAGSLKSRVPREILLGTGMSAAAWSLKSRVPREILLGTGVSAAAGSLKSRVPREILLGTGVSAATRSLKSRVP